MFKEALAALSTAALTNVNKVTGGVYAEKEYRTMAADKAVHDLLMREIELIAPKIILFCGTADLLTDAEWETQKASRRLLDMYHSSARENQVEMVKKLREQLKD